MAYDPGGGYGSPTVPYGQPNRAEEAYNGAGQGGRYGGGAAMQDRQTDYGELLWGSQGQANRSAYDDGSYIRRQIMEGIAGAGARGAPQMTQTRLDNTQQNQFRAREMALADQLTRVLGGQQKGAGEMAVNRQTGNAMNQALGAATMARGNNSASAARSAARATGTIGLGGAGMAREAALADQQSAGQQLAGVLGQGRGADIDVAGRQGAMDQQVAMQNLEAKLRMQGMNDQQIATLLGQLGNMNQAEMQARGADNGIAGGLLTGIGGMIGMASDARVKTEIVEAHDEIDTALTALTPYRYEYTDPAAHGEGSRVGVMAQHLEASTAGADLVTEIDGVKMIDKDKAISFLLASVAHLSAQVRGLQEAFVSVAIP